MGKHCVYIHKRLTDDRIFYVGKGYPPRAKSHYGRNRHWLNVAHKHGWRHEVVRDGMTEACAFSLERMLISVIGRDNLCNLTDGGEGASGVVLSPESRKAIGDRKRGTTHKPQSIELMREAKAGMFQGPDNPFFGQKHSEQARAKISEKGRGRKQSAETIAKRMANGRAEKHYKFISTLYHFAHDEHGIRHCTIFDLRNEFGLHKSHMYDVVKGMKKSHKGWRVADDNSTQ